MIGESAHRGVAVATWGLLAGASLAGFTFALPSAKPPAAIPVSAAAEVWLAASILMLAIRDAMPGILGRLSLVPELYKLGTPSRATGVVGWAVWPVVKLAAAGTAIGFLVTLITADGSFSPGAYRESLISVLAYFALATTGIVATRSLHQLLSGSRNWWLTTSPGTEIALPFRAQLVERRDAIQRPTQWTELQTSTGLAFQRSCAPYATSDIFAAGRYCWRPKLQLGTIALLRLTLEQEWEGARSRPLRRSGSAPVTLACACAVLVGEGWTCLAVTALVVASCLAWLTALPLKSEEV